MSGEGRAVSIIGTVNHPQEGTFHIFYNVETGLYGISKLRSLRRCQWHDLAAAFRSKGL